MDKSVTMDALTTITGATGKIVKGKDGQRTTANLELTTAKGPVRITLQHFDDLYRGLVNCWPGIKPIKDQVIAANREETIAEKQKAREEAEATKKAEREAAKKKRDEERAAAKAAKDAEAKAKKEEAEAKKKAEAEAKQKADMAKAKKAADAKAKKDAEKAK